MTQKKEKEEEEMMKGYEESSFLLEEDIKEEILSLSESVLRKEKTIEDILNLPKKISYDCLVPLSKVSFTPGQLIHTNEFSVKISEETGEREWMSHVEAAGHLKKECDDIRQSVRELEDYLGKRFGATAGGDVAPLVDKVKAMKKDMSHSQKVTEKEEYIPFDDEIEMRDENSDQSEEESEEDDLSGDVGEGQGFEIREYCDKEGNVLDGRVVDLSAELSKAQKGKTDKSQAHERNEDLENKLRDDLNSKLNVSTESTALNEDALFVRELAEIASNNKKRRKEVSSSPLSDDLDDLLGDLEKREAAAQSSQTAASKGLFSSSKWKKGFLSSPKSSTSSVEKAQSSKKKTKGTDIGNTDRDVVSRVEKRGSLAANKFPATTPQSSGGIPLRGKNIGDSSSIITEKLPSSSDISNDTAPPLPSTKKVSRFKQNRSAGRDTPSQNTQSQSGSNAFTGKVIEKFE